MKVNSKNGSIKRIKDEILAVFVFEKEKLPKEISSLGKFITKSEFEGKQGQAAVVNTLGKFNFRKLFVYGLGKKDEFNLDFLRRGAGKAVRYAEGVKSKSLTLFVPHIKNRKDAAQTLTEGALLAKFKFDDYKTSKDEKFKVEKVDVVAEKVDVSSAVKKGLVLANAQNYVREVNEHPSNFITPLKMAEYARKLSKEKGLAIRVFGKKDMERMKMNAILAVSKGSAQPPVLVVMEYNKGKKLPLYAVVGKGITFDSGGINLKPSRGMGEMKYDKSGAVNVLGIMKAVAELKLPIRVIGAFAATENMPGGNAQRPSDIVKAYNGKTIEVANTDAEGRMILADSIAYVCEKKPKAVIDMATLTGAMVVALGRHRIGLFCDDDRLAKAFENAGGKTHERVWRMPIDKEYAEMNKGVFGDIKNVGSDRGEGGSITAAMFVKEFVKDTKWAHLDIAAVSDSDSQTDYYRRGATGIGVRLVVEALSYLR